MVLLVHKHMLTHMSELTENWYYKEGDSLAEKGRVKTSVAVLVTRSPQTPPALHAVELQWKR